MSIRRGCEGRAKRWRDIAELTAHLGGLGLAGDVEGMMRHSTDYLELCSIAVVAWLWLWQAAAAKEALAARSDRCRLLRGEARAPRSTGSRPSCPASRSLRLFADREKTPTRACAATGSSDPTSRGGRDPASK